MGSMSDELLQSKRDRLADLVGILTDLKAITYTIDAGAGLTAARQLYTLMRKIDGIVVVITAQMEDDNGFDAGQVIAIEA